MKKIFFNFASGAVLFLITAQIFAESYVRIKPANDQPSELAVYAREIAPFARFLMNPVTPKNEDRPVMLKHLMVQVNNFNQLFQAINKAVLVLEKSKGVDSVNEGRVVAQGFYGGSDFVTLYPVHGDNVFGFRDRAKATVSLVTNESLDGFSGQKLSLLITGMYATWANGSMASVKGYFPIIGAIKALSDEPGSGVVSERETPYGTLRYEVPESSSENVVFRKIFIYGKRKGLKLLAQVGDGESKEFRCRHNSYITSCDFGGKGIVVPKGSTITITASEQGIFYPGFETLDVFCEGGESGRRIFITPLFTGGKG